MIPIRFRHARPRAARRPTRPRPFFRVLLGSLVSLSGPAIAAPAVEPLALRAGDHVAIVGNALADRMQHSGYFETLLHARYPAHELVVRNLAVAGDELVTRHRSENFGSPEDWLRKVQADVVLAFFGFNESFGGEAGLELQLLRARRAADRADFADRR
jgi:hypothetical protein